MMNERIIYEMKQIEIGGRCAPEMAKVLTIDDIIQQNPPDRKFYELLSLELTGVRPEIFRPLEQIHHAPYCVIEHTLADIGHLNTDTLIHALPDKPSDTISLLVKQMRWMTVLHDTGKQFGIDNPNHPAISAALAKPFLDELVRHRRYAPSTMNMVRYMIANHHLFEYIGKQKITIPQALAIIPSRSQIEWIHRFTKSENASCPELSVHSESTEQIYQQLLTAHQKLREKKENQYNKNRT